MTIFSHHNQTHKRLRWLVRAIGVLFLLMLLSITLPYAFLHPQVSDDYRAWVERTDFTNSTVGTDRVRLIPTNQEGLEERIRLITQAKERIIYTSFDFRADNSGTDVLALLLNAAQRGVKVELLLDGLMTYTQRGNAPVFQALAAQPNVEVRQYNPPSFLRPLEFHGRMHDKYVIVDEEFYLLGGRNTYDYFMGDYPTAHPSQDLEVLVWNTEKDECKGSMAQLLDYFQSVWSMDGTAAWYQDERLLSRREVLQAAQALEEHFTWMQETYPQAFAAPETGEGTLEAGAITLVSNPINTTVKQPQVAYTLTRLLCDAEDTVYLQTPYAVCDQPMYDALRQISDAVPNVYLLVNSVETGENFMASSDYMRHKGEILDTGVSLYEYSKGLNNHGKCAIIDDHLSIIGSFNWDMRAVYLDTELMLVIESPDFNRTLKDYELQLLADSRRCAGETTYDTPEGVSLPEISAGKAAFLTFLKVITEPIRYLL